jgi:hypothetical protein
MGSQEEAYNPNSASAEHRRGIEASHEKNLKDKVAAGDQNAQARLDALAQKKERMRNDYNDRMEREGVDKSQVPAYKRKEQGGDWKMSTKDLEKEKTNSPTSSAGLARKKAELGISELSKNTLKSYSKAASYDVHADQRDAGGARDQAAHSKKHSDAKQGAAWDDEAQWLDNRAEKRAGNIAKATTKIAQKHEESALETIMRLANYKK